MVRVCCWLLVALPVFAQNDASAPDRPVLQWHFNGQAERGVNATLAGKAVAGPRPPLYPGFAADNQALPFTGTGFTVREADLPAGVLRFSAKDAITLEAWVKVDELKDGSFAYLIGKGRNRKAGFPEMNQNYALRLKGNKQSAHVTFLFASAAGKDHPSAWHRWTSNTGFAWGGGWHHVAITYTFGNSKSIRGYIDGKGVDGTWDMGGATDRAPVTDADDLTMGTGNGGGAGNSFHGLMDELAVWHTALPAETLAGRYQHAPLPPAVVRAKLPVGRIQIDLCEEGVPDRNAWPEQSLPATESYIEDAFGFFTVAQKYVDGGVRGERPTPFMLRAAAVVKLPAGKHRLLLRGRGASRLHIDEKLVLNTPFPPPGTEGHNPVRKAESYLNLGDDFRFAPPGNREAWATFESKGGEHLVVLETFVGSYSGPKQKRRPELGETVVAIALEGRPTWQLLTPGSRVISYTDDGWTAYEAERTTHYDRLAAERRAALRQTQADYWQRRRTAAQEWLRSTPDIAVPALAKGFPAHNAIDHFLAEKLAKAMAESRDAERGTVDFYKDVKPIFEAKCFDCHAGTKVKGGLRLDDRTALLKGGKSGAAIVLDKPAEGTLLARVRSHDDDVMPPKGDRLTPAQLRILETWIKEGAKWPEFQTDNFTLTPLTDDLAFLRRITLDVVGVVPTEAEIAAFLADNSKDKRTTLIDRLLSDPRWADHWMGYWQDVLAENPNILNPTLNNTGPFRWWLYETLLDNKPFDLVVTELLRMRGSERYGGPAGFAMASQNDSPMATKGMIVASAFLGVEMKCARCHDAPAHASTQKDLFSIAALLAMKPLTVPATSSVPLDKIHQGGRKPLIAVTLKPGTTVAPEWPFPQFVAADVGKQLAQYPDDLRDRTAALITAPQNERFAQVLANRVWQRFMGRGLIDPVDDWEKGKPTHEALLRWLGRELVRGGYDIKQLTRTILRSHAYQRATNKSLKGPHPLYAAPAPRRLTAEQIVDSLFTATGKPFRTERASLDIDGHRDQGSSIDLGQPRRAWMLTSTSNERDRPSLSLPRIQAVADVLQAFGWRAARQEPTSVRELAPNVLQPAILSNGTMGTWLTRLSDDHGITTLALKEQSLEAFVDALFLKMLTRQPSAEERATYVNYLKEGYAQRVQTPKPTPKIPRKPVPYVSWSNHLDPEATLVRQQEELAARAGEPATERLATSWRTRLEDVLWAFINAPEFIFTP